MAQIKNKKKYPLITPKDRDFLVATQESTGKTRSISVGDLSQHIIDKIPNTGGDAPIKDIKFKGESLPVVDKSVEIPSKLSEYDNDLKGQVENIKTISDLRLREGKEEGEVIRLLGYYESGDKPELLYEWIIGETEDDGGSVIKVGQGYWKALFGDKVHIEHYGAKNREDISEILIKIFNNSDKKVVTTTNKEYLIKSNVNTIGNVYLELGMNTKIVSYSNTEDGIYPNVINITNADKVFISGTFNGGYRGYTPEEGNPKENTLEKVSPLLVVENCKKVVLEKLKVENFASNWSNSSTTPNSSLLKYSAVYVRNCEKVISVDCQLTGSRIEGFIFLGNKEVIVERFESYNNIGVWTPLHLFLNETVTLKKSNIKQNENSVGSTINLYNSYNNISENYIENGAGIDHSWEIDKDISEFNVNIKSINIYNNTIINSSHLLYSMFNNTRESSKENINIYNNVYINSKIKDNSTGIIRIDVGRNIEIYNNSIKTSSEKHYFFQTVGGIEEVNIYNNTVESDSFFVFRQANNPRYLSKNILINNNYFKSLPINGRDLTRENSSFIHINKSSNEEALIDNISVKNNNVTSEGRSIQIIGLSKYYTKNIKIENNESLSKNEYLTISNISNLDIINNKDKDSTLFCLLSRVSGKLNINKNIKESENTQTKGMFQVNNCELTEVNIIENIFKVPNPNTYGLIQTQNNTTITSKNIRSNNPKPFDNTILSDSTLGSTQNRNQYAKVGDIYFDTTENKLVTYNGQTWV